MNRPIIVVVTIGVACLLFSVACAEKTPADETLSEAPAEEIVVAQETSADQPSRAAYEVVLKEIKDLERSPSARANVEQTVQKIETKLVNFISLWPGTPEASDAKFQLGIMYSNMMQSKKAISYLDDFLKEDPGTDNNRSAVSHYYLAESHKNNNNFTAAKKHYQVVIDDYAAVNTKLMAMARNNLGSLDVMKQLAIGGEPLPFEVKDLKGQPLSLKKFKGKVVLLDFWATWCGPCRQEMPNVKRVYKKYNKDGFEIVGISLDNELGKVESYLKKNDVKWPQHFDGKGWNNGVAQQYKVSSIPATYLIDRKGKIRFKSLRGAALGNAVEQLIKEK